MGAELCGIPGMNIDAIQSTPFCPWSWLLFCRGRRVFAPAEGRRRTCPSVSRDLTDHGCGNSRIRNVFLWFRGPAVVPIIIRYLRHPREAKAPILKRRPTRRLGRRMEEGCRRRLSLRGCSPRLRVQPDAKRLSKGSLSSFASCRLSHQLNPPLLRGHFYRPSPN